MTNFDIWWDDFAGERWMSKTTAREIFRAGQEMFKKEALAARPPRHGGPGQLAQGYDTGVVNYENRIQHLPLEGDDES